MNITQIEYFLSLASSKSFKVTAEYLNVSTSAVSKQIKLLESEWGIRLFYRNYKDVELTNSGKIMYDMLMTASQMFSSAILDAHQNSDQEKPVISLGIIEKLNLPYIYQAIDIVRMNNPNITLYVEIVPASDLLFRHAGGKFDIVITHEHLLTSSVHIEKRNVARLEHTLYISSAHPRLKELLNGRIDLERLYYLEKNDSTQYSADFKFITSLYGFRPKEIIAMPNLDSILFAVNGFGENGYGGVSFLDSAINIPPEYHLTSLPTGLFFHEVIAWAGIPGNTPCQQIAESIYHEIEKRKKG